eukprot:scaffold562955_cov41-Prasinocladus_malaysianus.AAC.1
MAYRMRSKNSPPVLVFRPVQETVTFRMQVATCKKRCKLQHHNRPPLDFFYIFCPSRVDRAKLISHPPLRARFGDHPPSLDDWPLNCLAAIWPLLTAETGRQLATLTRPKLLCC